LARLIRVQVRPAPVTVVACLAAGPSELVKATDSRGPPVENTAVLTVPVPLTGTTWPMVNPGGPVVTGVLGPESQAAVCATTVML
jgi:hypothetical protein